MQQLVAALGAARQTEPDPRQQTLHTVIARQAPTIPSTSVEAVQASMYDITTPPMAIAAIHTELPCAPNQTVEENARVLCRYHNRAKGGALESTDGVPPGT